jgi:hypothetical protein
MSDIHEAGALCFCAALEMNIVNQISNIFFHWREEIFSISGLIRVWKHSVLSGLTLMQEKKDSQEKIVF